MNLIVSISGGIAVGKTTLCQGLRDSMPGAYLVPESVGVLRFLPRFYEDKPRYAFHSRLEFVALKAKQLMAISPDCNVALIDRSLPELITFARALHEQQFLSDDEFAVYEDLYRIVLAGLPAIDLVVWVSASTATMLQRIDRRGRTFERGITAAYLDHIDRQYARWISELPVQRTFRIDTTATSPDDCVRAVSAWVTRAQELRK